MGFQPTQVHDGRRGWLPEQVGHHGHRRDTMGRAAEMTGTTPGFLRSLGDQGLITPLRSEGGHRRYSRYQLRIAMRARDLVDQGTPVEAACRIIILEDQLEEALRINEKLRRSQHGHEPAADT
nr:hypothetical protein KPHV_80980 [Kitasatospora purpeofusca]